MIDLSDVSFLIPVSIDSVQREENLIAVLNYLDRTVKTNIFIGDQTDGGRIEYLKTKYNYIKIPKGECFHKTRVLNQLFKHVETRMICSYDSDVFAPGDQFEKAANLIRGGACDFVITYDGTCFNVPRQFIKQLGDGNFDILKNQMLKKRRTNSLGGSVFFDSHKFFQGGMENEVFKSWGAEDDERIHRFEKLGYRLERTHGSLYHVDHHRGDDSRRVEKYYRVNIDEFNRIGRMSKEELRAYVNTWGWLNV